MNLPNTIRVEYYLPTTSGVTLHAVRSGKCLPNKVNVRRDKGSVTDMQQGVGCLTSRHLDPTSPNSE
jgi:hypothetical protein